jgi:hypothetical protein
MEKFKLSTSGIKPEDIHVLMGNVPIYPTTPSAHAIPKGAPWKAAADKIVQRLLEAGIISKLSNNYFPANINVLANPPRDEKPKAFKIEHYIFPLMYLIIAHAMYCLVFLLELKSRQRDNK